MRTEPALHAARVEGRETYFTGKPCKRGHVCVRRVIDRSCVECNKIKRSEHYYRHQQANIDRMRSWREANPQKSREASNRWKRENPDRCEEITAAWREANREQMLASNRQRYAENREAYLSHNKRWASLNYGAKLAHNAKRRALQLQAIPPWLTSEHLGAIRQLYERAAALTRETGTQYHVDHIFPLKAENCCGLHAPWNLQILPGRDNSKKRNQVPNDRCAAAFLTL